MRVFVKINNSAIYLKRAYIPDVAVFSERLLVIALLFAVNKNDT